MNFGYDAVQGQESDFDDLVDPFQLRIFFDNLIILLNFRPQPKGGMTGAGFPLP